MSIIAWDGTCIAADRRSSNNDFGFVGGKLIEVVRGHVRFIVGWTGICENGLALLRWFEQGERETDWPKCQTKEDWCRLIILNMNHNQIVTYEQHPIAQPLHPENKFMAWGAGRDFALGAMAAGKTAIEAVEIASQFCNSCGNGVDVFRVD